MVSVRGAGWLILLAVLAVVAPVAAFAQPYDVPPTWGGDLWSRPRLTGDWFGFRDEMGKKGVVVDIDLLQTLQGNATGGFGTGVAYGGTADYTLHVDTGKAGLWPGGFFTVYAMSGFGDSANGDVGPLGAVSAAALLPEPHTSTALMNLTYMQFFATWIGVFAGKVYGLAAGLILIPWKDALVTVAALDPSGTPGGNNLGKAFDDGVLVAPEARVTIRPFGLTGHQLVGGYWSNKERPSLDQDPTNIAIALLQSRFPTLVDPTRSSAGYSSGSSPSSWCRRSRRRPRTTRGRSTTTSTSTCGTPAATLRVASESSSASALPTAR